VNIEKGPKENTIRCSDYNFVAFLITHDFKLLGLIGDAPRFDFLIEDREDRKELTDCFSLGNNDEISVNKFIAAQKRLQRLLRDRKSE
jgi:hypothetical protein